MDLRLASAVLPLGLLLLIITPGTSAGPVGDGTLPIRVSVEGRGLSSEATGSYSGSVVEGGVLLGALERLRQTEPSFRFTLKEDPDHGLFLESVNGVAGSGQAQSYWELLSAGAPGEPARLDAGEYQRSYRQDRRSDEALPYGGRVSEQAWMSRW